MSEIKENQPMSEYLSHEGIGSSTLKNILSSPRDYKYALEMPKKETKPQMLGTFIHTYMLERHLMKDEYMIQPEDWGPLTKNPGYSLWKEFKQNAEEQGKKPIKYKDGEFALRLNREMDDHEPLKDILSNAKSEVSFYTNIDGVPVKSREDLWCPDYKSVWDVKSCSKDIDDDSLSKVIFNNGYHFSAAHHMQVMKLCGVEVETWGWIFVSTGTPCPHIIIKEASEELIEAGLRDWHYAFNRLIESLETDSWDGYSKEIEKIGLPYFANKYYDKGL